MSGSPAQLLHDWHDFYSLVGTASATLVGLMFVAASIGANVFKEEDRAPMKAFITPTVVHFAAALFTSLLVVIPTRGWTIISGLLGVIGLAGVIYCGRIMSDVVFRRKYSIDLSDRLFYALLPFAGYVLVSLSAALLMIRSPASADLLAAGLLVLLFAGIRNAWDMTLWIVLKTPTGAGSSSNSNHA